MSINKEELVTSLDAEVMQNPIYRRISAALGDEACIDLVESYRKYGPAIVRSHEAFKRFMREFPGPINEVMRMLEKLSSFTGQNSLFDSSLSNKRNQILKACSIDVYYLPTYRRVEEDLARLGYGAEMLPSSDQLIHFGMADVAERFKSITEEIRESAIVWYSKISGRMLDELMGGFSVTEIQLEKIRQPRALEILLDRLGKNISTSRKAEILALVQSENISLEKYRPLSYFLSNLIEIYDQQREKDQKIKRFIDVANKYLVDKKLEYNESEVTIKVMNDRSGGEVLLDKLSSGEKQLVSILSKLYLEADKPFAVIFDEPELSLSIGWQRNILPDVVASGHCAMLLAATHSPFIFENDLDGCAEALKVSYEDVANG